MDYKPTFDTLLRRFLSELRIVGYDVSKDFGPEKSIEDMFYSFYNMDLAHQLFQFELSNVGKSEEQANELRSKGNQYFHEKEFEQAFRLYTQSIMTAPHPKINMSSKNNFLEKEHTSKLKNQQIVQESELGKDISQYQSLALGYANRSAVQFGMKHYDRCIIDSELAIKHGYPLDKREKLIERKCKSLIALKRYENACEYINDSISHLQDHGQSDSRNQSLVKRLNKLLQYSQNNLERITKNVICSNGKNDTDMNKKFIIEDIFKDLGERNSTIPNLSNAVTVKYTPDQGRFLVAQRNIHPGEMLVVEEAQSSSLLVQEDVLSSRCTTCLVCCHNPIPCPNCTMVVFCSEECRTEGLSTFHSVECQTLPSLATLHMNIYCPLAYRIITQKPFVKLRKEVSKIKNEMGKKSPDQLGFDEEGIYNSDDLRSIYTSVGHLNERAPKDLIQKCAMAFVLTKLLIKSNSYFKKDDGTSVVPNEDDICFIGSTLMLLLINLLCNAHTIEEFQVNSNDYNDCSSSDIGAAVFPVPMLMNHSCNPTTIHCTFGNYMVCYAIQYIPAGGEVTDSYGYHYAMNGIHERLTGLRRQYFFSCQCEACSGNWPTMDRLTTYSYLKDADVEKSKELGNQFKILSEKFIESYQNIVNGEITETEKNSTTKLIEFMNKHISLPNKYYLDAQEAMKNCIDRLGPCQYFNK